MSSNSVLAKKLGGGIYSQEEVDIFTKNKAIKAVNAKTTVIGVQSIIW